MQEYTYGKFFSHLVFLCFEDIIDLLRGTIRSEERKKKKKKKKKNLKKFFKLIF